MRVVSICLTVCFLNIWDIFVTGAKYNFNQYRRNVDDCNMCYLDQCWSLEMARCEYYILSDQSSAIELEGTTTDVDRLMTQLVDSSSDTDIGQECIPFITYYTDCQKENSCLGCKSCTCDSSGRWNCIVEQHCSTDTKVDDSSVSSVDHRVLNTVIKTLGYSKKQRNRRSLPTKETLESSNGKRLTYEQLVEWMYGVKHSLQMNFKSKKPDTISRSATNQHKSENTFKQAQNQNTDYIDFDDVLNTIGLPTNKRRKAKLDETSYDSHDELNEGKNVKVTDDFIDMFNVLESADKTDGDIDKETSTKVVIDLLLTINKNGSYNSDDTYDIEEETKNGALQGLLNTAKNIMKREIPIFGANKTKTDHLKHDANKTKLNNSDVIIHNLTEDVLNPINNIISEKENEIKYLFKVKQNLQKFIKSYNDTEIAFGMNDTKGTNDSFSIYKLDIYPELQYDLRKINPNSLDKLLYKLKRDIYEVVKDISGIQKISESRDLPDDLRALIEAMKFYIRNKNSKNTSQSSTKDKESLRRNANFYTATPISNQLINILKVIDEKKLYNDGLAAITPSSRKIVKRIVKNYFYDDSLNNGLQIYDPEYNLTNNLREIGVNWNRYVEILDNCDKRQIIYAMKLLHYGLSSDIAKISDALTLVRFAYSRRMVPVEGRLGEQITDGIINGLRTINKKIQYYVNFNKKQEKYEKNEVKTTTKLSFLKKIKNLLKGAKKDIRHLLQNKNSEVVNSLARKKFDEMSKDDQVNRYESTMKKWQQSLHIMRKKRSMTSIDKERSRLTNILPKYLRGKLNPAINANKKKAKAKRVTSIKTVMKKPVKQKHAIPTTVKHKMRYTTKLPKTNVKQVATSKPSLRTKTTKRSKIGKLINHLTKGKTKATAKPKRAKSVNHLTKGRTKTTAKPKISDILNHLTKGSKL